MSKIWLTKRDLEDIRRVLEKFPDIERFELHEHGQTGIGSLLDMEFTTEINDVKCKLVVPIADESTW